MRAGAGLMEAESVFKMTTLSTIPGLALGSFDVALQHERGRTLRLYLNMGMRSLYGCALEGFSQDRLALVRCHRKFAGGQYSIAAAAGPGRFDET